MPLELKIILQLLASQAIREAALPTLCLLTWQLYWARMLREALQ